MSEVTYFVIRVSEDGDASITAFTADELRRRLDENYWGETAFRRHLQLSETLADLNAEAGLIIIAGQQVTPTPRTTTTRWDIG